MIFYDSFYEACKDLPDDLRIACYDALIEYGITGKVPDNLQGIPKIVFVLSRPLLDANRKRGAAGALGGRPRKNKKPAAAEEVEEVEEVEAAEAEDEIPLIDPEPQEEAPAGDEAEEAEELEELPLVDPEPPESADRPPENPNKAAEKRAADEMFKRLWQQYPSKRGGGRISDTKKMALFKIGEEHMMRALNRYIAEHEAKARRGDFVPQWQNGSTWFNSGYVDFLDENYSESPPDTRPREKIVRNRFNNFTSREEDFDELARQIIQSQQID